MERNPPLPPSGLILAFPQLKMINVVPCSFSRCCNNASRRADGVFFLRASICGSAACCHSSTDPLRHRQHATLLPRPSVSFSGLGGRGAAGLRGVFHNQRLEDRRGVWRKETQVEGGWCCLRRFFIGFNIFFTIGTGLAIAVSLALLSPSADDMRDANKFEGRTTNRIVLYVWGSVSMAIAILGAFGAHKRNLAALTVFLVCVVIGSLLTLQAGVLAAAARPKLESLMEERWRSFLPLDQASEDVKNQVEALQTSLRCCGLFSYEDWEQNIPASCLCDQQGELEGKCQSVDYKNLLWNVFWQKKCVFRQTCFPLIMVSAVKDADVTLGVVFALFVMAMLGSVLSAMMIQMFNAPPAVPLTFVDRPPAYQQLYNLPE